MQKNAHIIKSTVCLTLSEGPFVSPTCTNTHVCSMHKYSCQNNHISTITCNCNSIVGYNVNRMVCKLVDTLLDLSVAGAQLTCQNGPICSKPLCPNTVVNYTCSVPATRSFTRWTVQCGGNKTDLIVSYGFCTNSNPPPCGPFVVENVPSADGSQCSTTSILSVNITSDLNGTSISCNNSDRNSQDFIGSVAVNVLCKLPVKNWPLRT